MALFHTLAARAKPSWARSISARGQDAYLTRGDEDTAYGARE